MYPSFSRSSAEKRMRAGHIGDERAARTNKYLVAAVLGRRHSPGITVQCFGNAIYLVVPLVSHSLKGDAKARNSAYVYASVLSPAQKSRVSLITEQSGWNGKTELRVRLIVTTVLAHETP